MTQEIDMDEAIQALDRIERDPEAVREEIRDVVERQIDACVSRHGDLICEIPDMATHITNNLLQALPVLGRRRTR
jgi:hypothetical protein